jgi:hypothetical protein
LPHGKGLGGIVGDFRVVSAEAPGDYEMRKHAACKSEATVAELRKLYSRGLLPAWKVRRLQKIAGWKW